MASQPNPQSPLPDQTEPTNQPSPAPPGPIRTVQDLRKDAHDTVPNTVDDKHPPVAAEDRAHSAGAGSKVWQVATLVIPILLTVWLTHVSSSSEDRVKLEIDQQTDQQKQVFAEQVQLSQDLYKRQFDTYDKLYAQLVVLEDAIEQLHAGSAPAIWNRRLADSLTELASLRRANRLHISEPVYKTMGDAWQKGARMNAQDLDQVEAQIAKEMKDLMDVDTKLRKQNAANKSGKSPRQN